MKLEDFDYELPKNLIAQKPVRPRDHSRLLVVAFKRHPMPLKASDASIKTEHKHFYDLPDYLNKGDILVLNNSKVFPARLIGRKAETGGKIEVLLLKKSKIFAWQCLLGGKGRKEGLKIEFGKGLKGEVIKNNNDGTWLARFNKAGKSMMDAVNKIGQTPLPPYIKKSKISAQGGQKSKIDYQTVYADDKKIGSVAAPTAGLHFTPALLKKIKKKGALIKYVTLHVGLGTFAPVKVENIKKHKMHAEWVEIKKDALARIMKAKKEGKKIVAVGTTSARALESFFAKKDNFKFQISNFKFWNGWTDIFICPGYKFKVVDAIITNFHLPKSTLLMLVSAFVSPTEAKTKAGCSASRKKAPDAFKGIGCLNNGAGIQLIKKAYQEAIRKKYRFYSYGDAMLIL